MTNPETTMPAPEFKDRKVGLIVFGILQIILGVICALLIPFMILGLIMSATINKNAGGAMPLGMAVASVLIYVFMAVWFIWLGIGSVKSRRWARALTLVSSWLWLISGVSGFIFMLALMPDMYGQMARDGKIPQAMTAIMTYIMLGFMSVIYIVIPGGLVLFYGRKDVRLTCERRDPQPRWTDKCPLPVLAISLIFAVWAVAILMTGFYGWVMPCFGYILSGIAGAGVSLATMAFLGYAAWGAYKLDIKAWWVGLLTVAVWTVSVAITFWRVDIMEFYAKMNLPSQSLELMKQYNIMKSPLMTVFFVFWVVAFLAYLIYVKRYFKGLAEPKLSVNAHHDPGK